VKGKLEKMGPLAMDHPLASEQSQQVCVACGHRFLAGDYVALVPLGPGPDREARNRALTGRPYTAVAAPVHWPCATGEDR
jgi:hypothetical protein